MAPHSTRLAAAAALLLLTLGPSGRGAEAAPAAGRFLDPLQAGTAGPAIEALEPEPDAPEHEMAAGEGPDAAVGGILLFFDSAEQFAIAADALERFANHGLDLPPGLEIRFHADLEACGGHMGLATHGGSFERIDLCCTNEFTLMHELAHAWAEHTLTEAQRRAFLEERGLQSWRDGVPWEERGTEHAAQIVAWGLGDRPIRLMKTPDSGFDRLASGFSLLTGHLPLFMDDEATAPGDAAPAAAQNAPAAPLPAPEPR
jgi:hypothetical protein